MRSVIRIALRTLVAMAVGAALAAIVALTAGRFMPTVRLDVLGGWLQLSAESAALCGVCALGLEAGVRRRGAGRLAAIGLVVAALVVGASVAVATTMPDWIHRFRLSSPTGQALAAVADVGSAVIAWLLVYAALAGIVAGNRSMASEVHRALVPLWLTPLWGAGAGVVYGALWWEDFSQWSTCMNGMRCYWLEPPPWVGPESGLMFGMGGGLIVGAALALALGLALMVIPLRTASTAGIERRRPRR